MTLPALLRRFFLPGSDPSDTFDDERRRSILYYCFVFGTLVVTAFALLNLFAYKDYTMAMMDGLFVVVLMTVRGLSLRSDKRVWAYRLVIVGYLLLNLYHVFGRAGEASRVLWIYSFPLAAFFLLGKVEGTLWTLLSLLSAAAILIFSPQQTWIDANSFRFLLSYFTVGLLTWVYEKTRHYFQMGVLLERERLKLEKEKLKEAATLARQAAEAKSLFLANMSHELRTPLNGIIGINSLLTTTPLDSNQLELVEMVEQSSNMLLEIVNNVLDFSKLEAGKSNAKHAPFGLRELLTGVHNIFAAQLKERNLTAQLDLPEGLPSRVIGDEQKIRQILFNLMNNAMKFTQIGGVKLSLRQPAALPDHYEFSVEDTGPGIPAERQQEVFEAFKQLDESMTREYGGTGLGLSISQGLAKIMGTTIAIQSRPEKGSRFFFTLHLPKAEGATLAHDKKRPQEEAAPEEPPSPAPDGALQILLVEDNAVNRRLQKALLEKLGCEVHLAEHGIQALSLLKEQRFDMVFMDIQMPELDGLEATRRIRAQGWARRGGGQLPIIAITAHATNSDRAACLAAGMDGYLSKPVKLGTLRDAIERHGASNPTSKHLH